MAKEALTPVTRAQLNNLKDALDEAIRQAVRKGMMQVVVPVHSDVDPTLVASLQSVLQKMGYGVTVSTEHGTIGQGILMMPKTTITVAWR